jgi:aryl-alcohol dehydrogenase
MAAKISGCTTIVAVDRVASRLDLARELGATHVIDAAQTDALEAILALGGVDFAIEATGVLSVAETAVRALAPMGACVLLSTAAPGTTMALPLDFMSQGRKVMGVVEGDADPQIFIPEMIAHYRAGRFPIDKLVRFYEAHDINLARADSENGTAIKPIVRMAAA